VGRRISRKTTVSASSARGRTRITWLTRAGVRFGLAGLFLLGAASSLQNAIAGGDTRALSFHHVHTGEDITVTFKRNGRFDKAELNRLDWFMRDWRENQQTAMDPHLIDMLWEVYREVGATQPIHIICGYRSPGTNSMLRARSSGVARNSQHVDGHAIDFFIPGVSLARIREAGMKLQDGGVGFYPTSGSPFIHMDTASVRHWPRMSREQLVKLFPDERTVHVPADGVPLGKFALALADVGRRGKSPNAVSLAQAREAGVITEQQELAAGQNVPQPGKNLLAALFGLGGDEDEDRAETQATPATASARPAAPVNRAPPPRIARSDRVPLPHARPKTFTVASADAKPIVVASAVARPVAVESLDLAPASAPAVTAEVQPVATAPDTPKPAAPPVVTAAAEDNLFDRRGYWQGVVEPGPALAALKAKATLAAANADPAATGSADVPALAYATPAEKTAQSATAAPMGARIAHLVSTANAGPLPANTTILAKSLLPATMTIGGQQFGSPWLRAALLTPSMRDFMSTTQLGARDPRSLQGLLHKPAQSLTMTFSADPDDGMVAHAFSGQAVVFLATTTFVRARTASLR
jgi:uncharacterized protein YcbK (DUF882 family)